MGVMLSRVKFVDGNPESYDNVMMTSGQISDITFFFLSVSQNS